MKDACGSGVSVTSIAADGSLRPYIIAPNRAAPIDCFYVYPTVSNQVGQNATKAADPEINAIALYQASRFREQCRVFVPIYRQVPLVGIFAGGFNEAARDVAYSDVVEAWNEYLATDNDGRGVVLIGHSQGTGMLRRLVREEIDRSPKQRRLLVSALLLGGNVLVEQGSDRGGDFENVPLCTEEAQVGCVIAFSTFMGDPPPDAAFGRPPEGTDFLTGEPVEPGVEVACVNPASIAANAESPADSLVPTEPFPTGLISLGILQLYGGFPPSAATTWVQPQDHYTGRCERTADGAHVLQIHPVAGARHLNASPDSTWGLHLVDVNGALGNLQDAVAAQTRAYLDPPKPRLKLRLRCAAGAVKARVAGADRKLVRRVMFRLRGAKLATDAAAPFSVRVGRQDLGANRAKLVAKAKLDDRRTAKLTKTLHPCA